jgi:hypothetical protein
MGRSYTGDSRPMGRSYTGDSRPMGRSYNVQLYGTGKGSRGVTP